MSNNYVIADLFSLCSKYGVRKFKDGDLEVEFTEVLKPYEKINPIEMFDQETPPLDIGESFHKSLTLENNKSELETLMIEDPEKYEEIISNEQLGDYDVNE